MLDGATFRTVISRFASGVTVITTAADGVDWGMTASAVCSLSVDPPMLLVCTNQKAATGVAASSVGHFAVNVLSSEQGWLAERFATAQPDKFATVGFRRGSLAQDPLLDGCLAHLECTVEEEVYGGTHRVLLARVVAAEASGGEPLTYFRGKFGRFEIEQHTQAYRLLFQAVVERTLPLHAPLVPTDLAARFDLPVSAAYFALTRLVADGLVVRDPERGYLQVTFDARQSIESYEVKRILDMAVVDRTVGKVSREDLDRLSELCDRANELVSDQGVHDVAAYRARAMEFQETMIGLTGNRALVASLRTLRIPELISLPQQTVPEHAVRIAANRRRIADGYLAGDAEATRAALNDQFELCRSISLSYIEASGGAM